MLVRTARGVLTFALAVLAVLVAPRPHAAGSSADVRRPMGPPAYQPDANADGVRALWVTRGTLTSPAAVARMVRTAELGGFNTLLVQVRGRGDAYYASGLEPRAAALARQPDFDPLAETIRLARAAGLRVHAWLVINLVSSAFELPAAPGHIVRRHPEWLMVPRELAAELLAVDPRSPAYVARLAQWTRARSTEVEGLYTSPVHPAAAAHMAAIVTDLATRYPLDGLHLDYIRYPHAGFDYSGETLQQFRAAVAADLSLEERRTADARQRSDPLAYPTRFPDRWDAFRRARLTALVMRLRTAAKTARPEAVVSAAVVPDERDAYTARLQDWRTWVEQSLVDVLCPMAYATDVDVFARQIAHAQDLAGDRPVWAGIGAYRLSVRETVRHIVAARRLRAPGVILFSYDALVSPPHTAATLAELGRTAFAAALD